MRKKSINIKVTHHEIAYPLLITCRTHINLTCICIINLNKLRNRKSEIYDVFLGFLKRILIFFQALLCQFRNGAVPVPVFSWQAKIKLVKFAKKTSNILEQNLGKIN